MLSYFAQKLTQRLKFYEIYKILENIRENLFYFRLGKDFSAMTLKVWSTKNYDKLELIKLNKHLSCQKTPLRKWKDEPQNEWKYLQIMNVIKDLHPKHIKMFYDWVGRQQLSKKWAKYFNRVSKDKRMANNYMQDAQCH